MPTPLNKKPSPAQILASFNQLAFSTAAHQLSELPKQSMREVAIVGRSNSGKSSLINLLANRKKLAFTSKTPGRTQLIVFFQWQPNLHVVDLPGYGYAKVDKSTQAHWEHVLAGYLQTREQLVGLVLVMDCRHPLQDLDWQLIDLFGATGKPIHLVLTKADKLTRNQLNQAQREVVAQFKDKPQFSVQTFSVLKHAGAEELAGKVYEWLR